jgi:hypothetical protein
VIGKHSTGLYPCRIGALRSASSLGVAGLADLECVLRHGVGTRTVPGRCSVVLAGLRRTDATDLNEKPRPGMASPDGASRVSGRIKMTLRKRQEDPTIAPAGNNPRF